MITIEKLTNFGANTKEGMTRCLNNENFYLKLVNKFLNDNSFNKLKEALANNDLDLAFEYSHALKGVLANLSLTPLYNIACELTELLRARTKMDYSPLLEKYEQKYTEFINL